MKPTLVLGASLNPSRYSNLAIHRLVEHGEKVYAFGLREGEVKGVSILTDREKVKIPHLDTITLYLGPRNQPPIYDWVKSLEPKRVIFNPGTENPEFEDMLAKEGIEVERACTLVKLSIDQY